MTTHQSAPQRATDRPIGLLVLGGLSILVALVSLVAIVAKSGDADDVTTPGDAAKAVEGPSAGSGVAPTASSVPGSSAPATSIPVPSTSALPAQVEASQVVVFIGDPSVVSGRVRDEQTKSVIGVQAQQMAGGVIDNQLVVDPATGPDGGTITLTGTVFGEGGEADALRNFEQLVGDSGYTVVSELDIDTIPLQLALSELVQLEPIGFDSKRSEIRPGERATLDKVAEQMSLYPTARIEVEGHTDNQGVPAENRALSQQRADAVVNYLVGVGVEASRLTPTGYGDERPVAGNDTDANRQRNRRIVFTVSPA